MSQAARRLVPGDDGSAAAGVPWLKMMKRWWPGWRVSAPPPTGRT